MSDRAAKMRELRAERKKQGLVEYRAWVTPDRAAFLQRMLHVDLCQCGKRELAECEADPCEQMQSDEQFNDEQHRLNVIDLARRQFATASTEGFLEIDDDAQLSEGDDNGTYLQSWVWVSFAGTLLDKDS